MVILALFLYSRQQKAYQGIQETQELTPKASMISLAPLLVLVIFEDLSASFHLYTKYIL